MGNLEVHRGYEQPKKYLKTLAAISEKLNRLKERVQTVEIDFKDT